MRNKWSVGSILAIDVGCQYETQFTNYGDCLSGWSVLIRRVFPFKYFFRKELKVPNLYDIQSRLSYVSCTRQLEDLKSSDYCEYIRPPIDKYQTLQFGSFDEIKEVGYQHGKTYFSGMLKGGRTVESVYHLSNTCADHRAGQKISLDASPTNFTDLAQIVCSVKKPTANTVLEDSSTEYDEDDVGGGYASEPNTNTEFFHKVSDELRRRRTGSLSDNDMIELNHAMNYDAGEEENDDEEEENDDDDEE